MLLNQSRIISALAPLGANVSSTNAKDIVRYLTDCERRRAGERPRMRSVTHLGWAEGALSAFMPYDAEGGEVRFDPSPDEAVKARPFMEAAGTLEGWVAGMAPVRSDSPAFRCVLAASFASAMVALLGVQTFIVYLWGRSRSGKTPTLKAAGSVWGDPTEGSDSYFRTFADTPKSIVRAAALFHDIPVIIDELQSKGAPGGQASKRQIVEDLLYSLSLGHERGALNSDRSMMRAGVVALAHDRHGRDPHRRRLNAAGRGQPHPGAQRRAVLRRARGAGEHPPGRAAARHGGAGVSWGRCGATRLSSTSGSSRRCATPWAP